MDAARGVNAVHAGHFQVHQDDLGGDFGGAGDGLLSRAGLPDDGDLRRTGQQRAHAFTVKNVIVCN